MFHDFFSIDTSESRKKSLANCHKLALVLHLIFYHLLVIAWLGSRVVSMLEYADAEGPGKIGSSPLKGCGGNCRPGGKYSDSLPPGL